MATLSLNENNPPNNTETNNNSMISDKLIFENATSLSSESSQQNKNIETKDDDDIFSTAQSISEPSTLENILGVVGKKAQSNDNLTDSQRRILARRQPQKIGTEVKKEKYSESRAKDRKASRNRN